MYEPIRLYKQDEPAYKNLEKAVEYLTAKHGSRFRFAIEDGFFDGGANWWWTSILTYPKDKDYSWWTLNPRDYEKIVSATSEKEVRAVCRAVARDRLYKAV